MSDQIRVILFKEGDLWVGQCLEYDIGAQARDLDELRARLTVAIEAERRESIERCGSAFAGIAQAPPYFHELWEKRSGNFEPRYPTKLRDGDNVTLELAIAA
ncbi:MAG TPA: hypothetical protein VND95_00245 [Stellaceae bacterium]|nr:hypothetical protein [Stellaceae bacterium]